MFQKASRLKLRFVTPAGHVTVEDLWDLPLSSKAGKANLDTIAVGLFTKLQQGKTVSFVSATTEQDSIDQLAFDVVKAIIDIRLAENAAEALKRTNAERKQALLALIARKESEALEGNSLEDLRKMAESLS